MDWHHDLGDAPLVDERRVGIPRRPLLERLVVLLTLPRPVMHQGLAARDALEQDVPGDLPGDPAYLVSRVALCGVFFLSVRKYIITLLKSKSDYTLKTRRHVRLAGCWFNTHMRTVVGVGHDEVPIYHAQEPGKVLLLALPGHPHREATCLVESIHDARDDVHAGLLGEPPL